MMQLMQVPYHHNPTTNNNNMMVSLQPDGHNTTPLTHLDCLGPNYSSCSKVPAKVPSPRKILLETNKKEYRTAMRYQPSCIEVDAGQSLHR